jgi:SAM-dependent methyltransferase
MILDGDQGTFTPPLYQEHDFGVLISAGDLYVRQTLTPGELLTVGMARGRVLELGAGSARVSRHLRDQGLEAIATDADSDLVAMYKTRGWADARQVTLPDIPASLGKFDTVIALRGVLSLAGELDLVLRSIRNIRRLLNPGGRLIFTSSRVSALLLLPGRSPLEYRVRFIYRGCRSPWLRATAIPEWLAIPLLKEEGFVTVETVESSVSDGAGYYVFATASG